MLKNHLLVALRTLARHRSHTALAVSGLALGMTVCLLILAFAWEQKTYDRFHRNADRVVRILSDRVSDDGDVTALAATPAPLAEALVREAPGIEQATRLGQIRAQAVYAGNAVALHGLYVEPSFFDLFDFGMEEGDARAALATPGQILLTPKAVATIFGTGDPLGQTVTLEGHGDFVVAGVLAPPPGRSHLAFDVLASFATLATTDGREALADWNNSWTFATYLLLDRPSSAERVAEVLPTITQRVYAGQDERINFRVQPLKAVALGPVLSNEIASYSVPALAVYLLGALGLVIMLTAGFSYVNLSVARAVRRAREVGTRKTLGASAGHVLLQFLSEAVVVALGSLVVAYALLLALLPAFNGLAFVQLMEAPITPSVLLDLRLLVVFVAFSIGIGLLAGLYPALRLAFVQPVSALNPSVGVGGFSGQRLRHSLIGVQFALALFFVTTTALLLTQARHLIEADYGFRQSDVLTVALQGQPYDVLREELLRSPSIADVAATSKLPASGSTARVDVRRSEDDPPLAALRYAVDPSFFGTLDLDLVAGRSFSREIASDTSGAVVLNERAVASLGFGTPLEAIGATLAWGESGEPVEVIGVVEDYHADRLTEPIGAVVLYAAPQPFRYAIVRARPGGMEAASAHVAAVWKQLDPLHAVESERFDHVLADGELNRMLGALSRLIGGLAFLAVVISGLGLFGMVAYHVETRTKEVGVRKVLGASRESVALLLSRDFLWLIGVACAVALPVTWLASEAWLQFFATRIEPSFALFVLCALGLGVIALAVTASQTLRAASADPVRSLRTE